MSNEQDTWGIDPDPAATVRAVRERMESELIDNASFEPASWVGIDLARPLGKSSVPGVIIICSGPTTDWTRWHALVGKMRAEGKDALVIDSAALQGPRRGEITKAWFDEMPTIDIDSISVTKLLKPAKSEPWYRQHARTNGKRWASPKRGNR